MEYYEELMKRVECVVEEKIDVNMSTHFTNAGVDVSLYCAEYDFDFAERVQYRDIEIAENPVLEIGNRLVHNFECELVGNIEVK